MFLTQRKNHLYICLKSPTKSMKLNILFISLIALFSINAFSQKAVKYYYDKSWKGCSMDTAYFLRMFKIDSKGKPVGEIKDYYISEELQGIAEGAAYIDKEDDHNSKFLGRSIGYFKNGNINFTFTYDTNSSIKRHFYYYENGNIQLSYYQTNGKSFDTLYYENGHFQSISTSIDEKLEGIYTSYYEDGMIDMESNYKNDTLDGVSKVYNQNGQIATLININKGIPDSANMLNYIYKPNGDISFILEGFIKNDRFTGNQYIKDKGDSVIIFHKKSNLSGLSMWSMIYRNSLNQKPIESLIDDFSDSQSHENWLFKRGSDFSVNYKNTKREYHSDNNTEVHATLSKSKMNIDSNNFDAFLKIDNFNNPSQFAIYFGFQNFETYNSITINPIDKTITKLFLKDGKEILKVEYKIPKKDIKKIILDNARLVKNKNTIKLIISNKVLFEMNDTKISGNQFGLSIKTFGPSSATLIQLFKVAIGDESIDFLTESAKSM